MELKILCPQWGQEHLPVEDFFIKVKEAGYDGVDTWLPEKKEERSRFIRLLKEYDLSIVSHQHQATGHSIADYCRSYEYYLSLSLECDPLLINSHSGRDYFTIDQQLKVLDVARQFEGDHKIIVAHETHRGRMGFSPAAAATLFALRPDMKITADFSHWVCVTESYLDNFSTELDLAIERTAHTHARVGFPEGPQVPDPSMPHWQQELKFFLGLWMRIFDSAKTRGEEIVTITPEAGPPPYMWVDDRGLPVADQWEVNLFMKDILAKTFSGKTA